MTSNRIQLTIACLIASGAAAVLAQYQVNSQVGNPNPMGSVRYSQNTYLMPSETRNALWQSGATRSEVRMNARAVGPLAAGGTSSYIPQSYELGKSYQTTSNNSLGSVRNIPQPTATPTLVNPSLTNPAPAPPPNPVPLNQAPLNSAINNPPLPDH